MTNAAIIQFQKKPEAKFMCSACGGDRACDCNAPAIEKLAEIKEQARQRYRAYKERKREQKQQSGDVATDQLDEIITETSDADHEDGLRVIAARGILNRAVEAKELATLGKLQSADVTEAMIHAAEGAATAWDSMARNLRRMIDE